MTKTANRPETNRPMSEALSSDARLSPGRRRGDSLISALLGRYALLAILVLLTVLFCALQPDTFATSNNAILILSSQSVFLVLSVGLLFPLVGGEFDLSIGYNLGFTAMVLAVLSGQHQLNPLVAGAISLGTGALVGVCNAVLVLTLKVNAFIATLASGTILQGLTLWISHSAVVGDLPEGVSNLGTDRVGDVPVLALFAVVIAAVCFVVLEYTPFGRYLYATGAGREAATLAGVRTSRLLACGFVLSGLIAGVSGVMQTAILSSANPNVGGQYMLPAFAACFLGATAIKPGRFNVPGTVIALFVLAVGIAGLTQLGAPLWVSPVFNGVALIVAVALSIRRRTRLAANS